MNNNINPTQNNNNSSLSIAGFVCSLCGFITCGLTSIVGLVLSIIGLQESKKKGQPYGMAIAGIAISSILLIFILMMLIAGAGSNTNTESNSSKTESSKTQTNDKQKTDQNNNKNSKITEKTYTQIDIDVLEDALENNAAAAKDEYDGKYLEITGRLGTIDSDLKYISLLSPTDDWDFVGVHCTIKNQETKDVVKTLTKDQTIIVRGKITDVGEVLGYFLDVDEIIPQ